MIFNINKIFSSTSYLQNILHFYPFFLLSKYLLQEITMKLITKNKRAYFDYQFEKEYQAGIILKWFEVKAVKSSHINIQDGIVKLNKQEVWLYNMDIPLYSKTAPILAPSYLPKAPRKLLLTKREITKIAAALDKPGMVLLPLEIYIAKWGFIKLKIWLWKLYKKIEKKQILKEKDIKKQMDREIKQFK